MVRKRHIFDVADVDSIPTMSVIRGALTVDSQPQGSEAIPGRKNTEYCGVVGFKGNVEVSYTLYYALRSIQHRGQESAGISVFNEKIKVFKGMGLVHEVLIPSTLAKMSGNSGIGHVRYSTAGASVITNAQPIMIHSMAGDMAIGHNGEISNAEHIKNYLESHGASFATESDTELILKLFSLNIAKYNSVVEGIKKSMPFLIGSYSLVFQVNDRVFGIRDPLGIRPLVVGKIDGGYGLASESVAFDALDGQMIRDVYPGEIVEVTEKGLVTHYVIETEHKAHCMFEYVYFARADSIINKRSVYEVRKNLGKILAIEQPVEADVVVPVPDSGRTHALGYSEQSKIPFSEGLMKNRYVERTFIMPEQKSRVQELKLKLNPVKEVIEGKRIVLIDDSIVRGNTTRKIVALLKKNGAKEVHVRIGSPPIRAPCYLGIDMKTRNEFIATGKTVEEIQQLIEADSLGYLSIDGLVKAIGLEKNDICMGCLTGIYPVPIKGENYRAQVSLKKFYSI